LQALNGADPSSTQDWCGHLPPKTIGYFLMVLFTVFSNVILAVLVDDAGTMRLFQLLTKSDGIRIVIVALNCGD
jgi:hypothetical protein